MSLTDVLKSQLKSFGPLYDAKTLRESFSFDYRSMELFRILLGLYLVVDCLYRLPDLTNMYTDMGLMTRADSAAYAPPFSFSLMNLGDGPLWAGLFFALEALCGILIMLGYRTRVVLPIAAVIFVSIYNRCVVVNNGGDIIFKCLLLIACFLPLGRYFSLDEARSGQKVLQEKSYFSAWVLALYVQDALIYIFTFLFKTDQAWRSDYTALYYSLRLHFFATPVGVWLRGYPGVLKFFTSLVINLEWIGPLTLFFCWFFRSHWWIPRMMLVIAFLLFHLGIMITMWLGLFPAVCMLMWIIFIPGRFWDFLSSKGKVSWLTSFQRTEASPIAEIKPRKNIIVEGLGLVFTLIILYWNLTSQNFLPRTQFMLDVVNFLQINQSWIMFSPRPVKADIWLEVNGESSEGGWIDLKYPGGEGSYSRKQVFYDDIPNERWSHFLMDLMTRPPYMYLYSQYQCRKWNDRGQRSGQKAKIKSVEVIVKFQENFLAEAWGEEMLFQSRHYGCGESFPFVRAAE